MKIIISGRGGHGIQFLSMLFAKTMIEMEMFVTMIKSYGPEARGGNSTSFITIDTKPIANPVFKKADILVTFEKETSWVGDKIIYSEENNMFVLGKLIKEMGLKTEPFVETMKKEISSKYSHLLESNIENLKKGYGV